MAPHARHLGHRSLALIAFVAIGCTFTPEPVEPVEPPHGPDPITDAGTPEPSPAATTCETACARLKDLGCKEGEPSPDKGTPCEVWFCDVVDQKIVDFDLACLSSIESCADVDGVCRK
jgi:hypothetical protein